MLFRSITPTHGSWGIGLFKDGLLKRSKKMGPMRGHGRNHFDESKEEAQQLNDKDYEGVTAQYVTNT